MVTTRKRDDAWGVQDPYWLEWAAHPGVSVFLHLRVSRDLFNAASAEEGSTTLLLGSSTSAAGDQERRGRIWIETSRNLAADTGIALGDSRLPAEIDRWRALPERRMWAVGLCVVCHHVDVPLQLDRFLQLREENRNALSILALVEPAYVNGCSAAVYFWSEPRAEPVVSIRFPANPLDLAAGGYRPFKPHFLDSGSSDLSRDVEPVPAEETRATAGTAPVSGSEVPAQVVPSDLPDPRVDSLPPEPDRSLAPRVAAGDLRPGRYLPEASAQGRERGEGRSRAWVGILIAVCVILCVALGSILWLGIGRFSAPQSEPLAQDRQTVLRERREGAQIELQIVRKGTDLHISWDHSAPWLTAARAGVMTITDGGARTVLELNESQLRTMGIIYAARSGDVEVRLDATGADSVPLAHANMRVIQAGAKLDQTDRSLRVISTSPAPGTGARDAVNSRVHAPETGGESAVPKPESEGSAEVTAASGAPLARGSVNAPPRILIPPGETRLEPVLSAPPELRVDANRANSVQVAANTQSALPPPGPSEPVDQAKSVVNNVLPAVLASPPVPVRQAPLIVPDYLKRWLRSEMIVEVTAMVDIKGHVYETRVDAEAGWRGELARTAAKTASAWQFRPASLRGQPIPGTYVIRFKFNPLAAGVYR